MFQFKKHENKSDLKEIIIYLFLRDDISNKLFDFKENLFDSFFKQDNEVFLKFKEQANAHFLFNRSSKLNKNWANLLDSLITNIILRS
jgi:hypothetical protein